MFARPEGWPSGLRRTPGERVGALPLVGSNPTPSATFPVRLLDRLTGACRRAKGSACQSSVGVVLALIIAAVISGDERRRAES